MPPSRNTFRTWIHGALLAGGGFAFVCLIAAAMWTLLAAIGDGSGAFGARGVALAAALCCGASFIALVVLLACDRIFRENEEPG